MNNKTWYEILLDILVAIFKPKEKEQELFITSIPRHGDSGKDVKTIQRALNAKGYELKVDGDFGNLTKAAVVSFQKSKGLRGSGIMGPKTIEYLEIEIKDPEPIKNSNAPWFWKLKKYEGKSETDPQFNKEMSEKWHLVGLDLKTISKNWAAWCGLFVAVGLAGVGYKYQTDGGTAKRWDKFGQKIEWKVNGFPQGAIIRINHRADCKSGSGNHVTMANGNCAAADLNKSGATFSGYGGNQGNKAKVSSFPVKNICSVSWPKELPLPGKVLRSKNCSNGETNSNESTR